MTQLHSVKLWIFIFCVSSVISLEHYQDEILYKKLSDLKRSLKGHLFFRGSVDYESARSVHNGVCRYIFPLVIIKPRSTRDVSKAVLFAKENGIEISMRSGGHSYQCLGTKVSFFVHSIV